MNKGGDRERERRNLEFQGAQRVRYILNRVHQAMCVVIRGVDTPTITSAGMLMILDAVSHKISHVWKRRGHSFLSSQDTIHTPLHTVGGWGDT